MKTNTGAKALYEKHGFCVCGENHSRFLLRCPAISQEAPKQVLQMNPK